MKNLLRIFVLSLAAVVTIPAVAQADQPGKHPAYLHALTDLRDARWNLKRRGGDPEMKWDEGTAIAEIDAAIGEIKKAAIDDGKNLEDHPKEDAGKVDRGARLHEALRLLKKAHHDIHEKEDNAFADGLRDRATGHLDKAINFTEQGISNAEHR